MRQDREFYRDLAARYLEADTTAEEEKILAEYLARYAESAEDKALARLLMLEHNGCSQVSGAPGCADTEEDSCMLLSDEAEREFDRLVSGRGPAVCRPVMRKPVWKRILWYVSLPVCAAIALAVVLLHTGPGNDPGPETPFTAGKGRLDALRIAGNIQSLMDMADGHIASVSARPSGDAALVTARFTDGTSRLYIMTYNGDEGSASLVALNE